MIAGVKLTESQARRVVPKYGMTREDVEFAYGSKDLVARVIKEGWLVPLKTRPVLFDAGDVAKAWTRVQKGEAATI